MFFVEFTMFIELVSINKRFLQKKNGGKSQRPFCRVSKWPGGTMCRTRFRQAVGKEIILWARWAAASVKVH